jgi:broad specificity phosphatase PhoE
MKKHLFLLLSVCLVSISCAQETKKTPQATTTETSVYYLIRHAEKDRSDKTNKDPNLTEAGHKRAAYWASVFENVPFDAIYSTNYNRTKQTAQPTATAKGLKVMMYHPTKMDMDNFLKETRGKTVLVVGHSNTTPAFVNRLIRKENYEQIDDRNNGNVYIVTISGASKTAQLLTIN